MSAAVPRCSSVCFVLSFWVRYLPSHVAVVRRFLPTLHRVLVVLFSLFCFSFERRACVDSIRLRGQWYSPHLPAPLLRLFCFLCWRRSCVPDPGCVFATLFVCLCFVSSFVFIGFPERTPRGMTSLAKPSGEACERRKVNHLRRRTNNDANEKS